MNATGPIYTLGHSNRTVDELVEILRGAGVVRVADVRRYPGSRRHPQFGGVQLARALDAAGMAYRHFPDLGGYREASGPSAHRALDHPGFRAYADYMATPVFRAAVDALVAWSDRPIAALCAEASPLDCHRGLLADALVRRGVAVVHLIDAERRQPHRSPVILRWEGDRPVYDGGVLTLDWTSPGEEA